MELSNKQGGGSLSSKGLGYFRVYVELHLAKSLGKKKDKNITPIPHNRKREMNI